MIILRAMVLVIWMNSLNTARKIFDKINVEDHFLRIDHKHPLNLFAGYDFKFRPSLHLTTNSEFPNFKGTGLIEVDIDRTDLGENKILISLTDITYIDVFIKLTDDLTEYSSGTSEDETHLVQRLIDRFHLWKILLSKPKQSIMSLHKIKGLYGELIWFNQLIDKYSYRPTEVLHAWTGPEKFKRDFELADIWYEVKAVDKSKSLVNISSLDQLDHHLEGELVVCELIYTYQKNTENSLDDLVNHTVERFADFASKEKLYDKIIQYGYSPNEHDYSKYTFYVEKIKKFTVDSNTEILRRKNIPKTVKDVSYLLDTDKLQ